eukprot:scaffold346_cov116-Cylindrotheca_fusiformis.AAC.33
MALSEMARTAENVHPPSSVPPMATGKANLLLWPWFCRVCSSSQYQRLILTLPHDNKGRPVRW